VLVGDEGGGPVDPDVSVFDVEARRERVWDIVAVIAAGGAIGGAARYLLNQAVPSSDFPWVTFIENVTGCFLLGALMVYLLDVWPPNRYLRPFLGVGVLGGFTTFSAYTVETRGLLAEGRGPAAMTYLFGSLLVGLAGTWLGITTARAITRETR
jgi:CrcB protein